MCGAGTIWAVSCGFARAVSSIAWACDAFIAIRASQSTCLPSSRAAMVTGACRYGHVPMHTASMPSSSTISRQWSATRGMPNSLAARCPDSRERLATATTSTPGCFCSPGMWNFLVLAPAPTIPTRSTDGSAMT